MDCGALWLNGQVLGQPLLIVDSCPFDIAFLAKLGTLAIACCFAGLDVIGRPTAASLWDHWRKPCDLSDRRRRLTATPGRGLPQTGGVNLTMP